MTSSSGSNGMGLHEITFNRMDKRFQKELEELKDPPNGFRLISVSANRQSWDIEVKGPPETIYANETNQLQVEIPQNYPYHAPQVIFTDPVPVHPKVYSDGHICLDELYDKWKPGMTLNFICVSIHSMLCKASVNRDGKA